VSHLENLNIELSKLVSAFDILDTLVAELPTDDKQRRALARLSKEGRAAGTRAFNQLGNIRKILNDL